MTDRIYVGTPGTAIIRDAAFSQVSGAEFFTAHRLDRITPDFLHMRHGSDLSMQKAICIEFAMTRKPIGIRLALNEGGRDPRSL